MEAGSTCGDRQLQQLGGGLAGGQRDAVAGARGAVGVAGVDQDGAGQARRERFRWRRHSLTGAACTRFCVNTAAALAGSAAHDQREVVLLRLANAGVGGGVEVSKRQVHVSRLS